MFDLVEKKVTSQMMMEMAPKDQESMTELIQDNMMGDFSKRFAGGGMTSSSSPLIAHHIQKENERSQR